MSGNILKKFFFQPYIVGQIWPMDNSLPTPVLNLFPGNMFLIFKGGGKKLASKFCDYITHRKLVSQYPDSVWLMGGSEMPTCCYVASMTVGTDTFPFCEDEVHFSVMSPCTVTPFNSQSITSVHLELILGFIFFLPNSFNFL